MFGLWYFSLALKEYWWVEIESLVSCSRDKWTKSMTGPGLLCVGCKNVFTDFCNKAVPLKYRETPEFTGKDVRSAMTTAELSRRHPISLASVPKTQNKHQNACNQHKSSTFPKILPQGRLNRHSSLDNCRKILDWSSKSDKMTRLVDERGLGTSFYIV